MNSASTLSLRSLLIFQLSLIGGFIFLGSVAFFFVKQLGPDTLAPSADHFLANVLTTKFMFYLIAGFVAQLVDGSLGMAYGVTSTSLLLSTGIPPAVASASVHVAEVFTTGASGISHWRFGNVRKDLFMKLALPGAAGAALGAYVLTSFDGNVIRPYVAGYLLLMGVLIFLKTLGKTAFAGSVKHIRSLAVVGGFVDASGGGGWGPVVTSTLLSAGTGQQPRVTIGTINAVEFVVALTASGVFSLLVGISDWHVLLGLIFGGVLAAPLGAYVCHKINPKACMVLVGLLIVFLSIRTLIRSL
jgi:uncharacterized membrane protein YfcA